MQGFSGKPCVITQTFINKVFFIIIMLEKTLKQWNIWWVDKKVPENKKRIPRQDLLKELLGFLSAKEVLVLSGVRRCGKSTMAYQLIDVLLEKTDPKNILYFNFDDPVTEKNTDFLENVFRSFLKLNNPKGKKFVFFDEIQNVAEWEKWVKKYYDLFGDEIKFVLTGSNNTLLSDNLSKLLTGRILVKKIFPLSFKEFLSFNKFEAKDFDLQKEELQHYFSRYLLIGGFPEVVLEKNSDINIQRLREYSGNILFRDIVLSQEIRETAKLNELANHVFSNVSSPFSYNSLSKVTGLNIHTVKEYLFFLENAYLVFQVNFFSYSLKESLAIQKPRKIYCIDNGLRNAVSFNFSKDEGRLAENIVFIELRRRGKEVHYWKGKKEIDFVIKNRDNSLTAINVTYTDTIPERETSALKEFREKFNKTKDLILITKNTEKTADGVAFIPLWKWLLKTTGK